MKLSDYEKDHFIGVEKDGEPYIGAYLKEPKKDGNLASDVGTAVAAGVGLGALGTAAGMGASEVEKARLGNRLNKIAQKTKFGTWLKNELFHDTMEGLMSAGNNPYLEYLSNMREIARHKLADQEIVNIAKGTEWKNNMQKLANRFYYAAPAEVDPDNMEEALSEVPETATEQASGEKVRLPAMAAGALALGIGAGIAIPASIKINRRLLADYKNRLDGIIAEATKDNYGARLFVPFMEMNHNKKLHRLATVS